VPERMWLSHVRVDGAAAELDHDLAIHPGGGQPSRFDFDRSPVRPVRDDGSSPRAWVPVAAVGAVLALAVAAARWVS
jgi:hypothetical protein